MRLSKKTRIKFNEKEWRKIYRPTRRFKWYNSKGTRREHHARSY